MSATEVARRTITAIFSRPARFDGVACSGSTVVAGFVVLYYSWVWRRWDTLVSLQRVELRLQY